MDATETKEEVFKKIENVKNFTDYEMFSERGPIDVGLVFLDKRNLVV